MNNVIYYYWLDAVVAVFFFIGIGGCALGTHGRMSVFNTATCVTEVPFKMLPKVSIDSVLIMSQDELSQLDYEINDTVGNVQILIVTEDTLLARRIRLRNSNAGAGIADTLKVVCNSFVMMGVDFQAIEVSGLIVFAKDHDLRIDLFKDQETISEVLLQPDESVGECGIKKTTTLMALNNGGDSLVKFVNYLPIDKTCRIDLINYDEFIPLSKEAYIVYEGQEKITGQIWNSPEGYTGR